MSRTPCSRSTPRTRREPGPLQRRLPRWMRRALRAWARRARRWASAPARASWGMRAAPLEADALVQESDERRCGWFDSSQDLREGLRVSEHDGGDAVCAQLPVMAWVQLQLSGWRPELSATLR